MTSKQNRVEVGVPSAGQWTATSRAEAAIPPLGSKQSADVLTAALDTDRNPSNIPWPTEPENSRVEVWVEDGNAWQVLERHGYDGDVVENYQRTYASIDLAFDKEVDLYGVTADGKEDLIAQGVRNYEVAVDPDDHESLNYREGFTDPMPPYFAAREETNAARLLASRELLHEVGVTVETEDSRRGHFRLRRDDSNLRLEISDYDRPKLIETRNWHEAGAYGLDDFMGGHVGEGEAQMFTLAATLVARDNRANPENADWAPADEPEPEARINGFSVEDVETYLQDEQHEDSCACRLTDGICATKGGNWRGKTSIANVDAVFGALAALGAAGENGEAAHR